MEYQERNKEIIRTSVVGIAANVLLAGFKAVVGAIAGSVAIIMDAVNNLSDALFCSRMDSIITPTRTSSPSTLSQTNLCMTIMFLPRR